MRGVLPQVLTTTTRRRTHIPFLVLCQFLFTHSQQVAPSSSQVVTVDFGYSQIVACQGVDVKVVWAGYHNIQETESSSCTSINVNSEIEGYKTSGNEETYTNNELSAAPGETRYFKCSTHCGTSASRFEVSCPASTTVGGTTPSSSLPQQNVLAPSSMHGQSGPAPSTLPPAPAAPSSSSGDANQSLTQQQLEQLEAPPPPPSNLSGSSFLPSLVPGPSSGPVLNGTGSSFLPSLVPGPSGGGLAPSSANPPQQPSAPSSMHGYSDGPAPSTLLPVVPAAAPSSSNGEVFPNFWEDKLIAAAGKVLWTVSMNPQTIPENLGTKIFQGGKEGTLKSKTNTSFVIEAASNITFTQSEDFIIGSTTVPAFSLMGLSKAPLPPLAPSSSGDENQSLPQQLEAPPPPPSNLSGSSFLPSLVPGPSSGPVLNGTGSSFLPSLVPGPSGGGLAPSSANLPQQPSAP